jgi:hypothetical protein
MEILVIDRSPLGKDYSVTSALLRRSPAREMGQSLADACVLSPVRALRTLSRGKAADVHKGRVSRLEPFTREGPG